MNLPPIILAFAVDCALGNQPADIVDGLKQKCQPVTHIPLAQIQPPITRPYYRLTGLDHCACQVTEAQFYRRLVRIISQALNTAALSPRQIGAMGFFLGSTANDIPIWEPRYRDAPVRQSFFSQNAAGYGNIADTTMRKLAMRGPAYTFNTACTSSANALLYAAAMVRGGALEHALVVGFDLFSHLGFYGFEALKLIASGPYRPFDRDRTGMILGEGCAAVVLAAATPDAAADRFCLLGGANGCDHANVTTHDAAGSGIAAVIQRALADADLHASDIDLIKAHATGSQVNDLAEANGLKRVFQHGMPPVTALKSYIGHTVGACGAVELAILLTAWQHGFVPATPGFENMDPQLEICPTIEHLPAGPATALLNFFGFGGNCTCLVVGNQS